MKRICVFCGSSPGVRPEYAANAKALGEELARRRITLVYGGATVGLMGIVADTVLSAGGEAIGVIPRSMVKREIAHLKLTELHVVQTMHERKAMMEKLSDGFIALPGGYGTLEEFSEILTWSQLGLHQKPCALMNVLGYYDQLLAFVETGITEGFIREKHRDLFLSESDPSRLLDRMKTYVAPQVTKWLDRPGS